MAQPAFDHTKHFRPYEHVRGLSVSESISLGVKLHCPGSHFHQSMTRNSIEDLVTQWPNNIYITAGFYYIWISWGGTSQAQSCGTSSEISHWTHSIIDYYHPLIMSSCHNASVFVSVSVTEDQIPHGFPTIDMGPQLKVVERTRTATMLCAASGNPDPEIYWFKDFLPVDISSSNGRIKQLRSGKALMLCIRPCTCLTGWQVLMQKKEMTSLSLTINSHLMDLESVTVDFAFNFQKVNKCFILWP